ncbi:hypothetical protein B9Z55_028218 [Caenorhabditis nigoni]|uniref:Protein kinase domain-containing protein n=1 Tax=Caenorhabditis nigoni TaxID=1611254 RepID=A0A2G5SCB3_9PELO|nr:hypothetical protein B9Z55_028218 [Caenorhabditis nigoni]
MENERRCFTPSEEVKILIHFRNIEKKRSYVQNGAVLNDRYKIDNYVGDWNGERFFYARDLQVDKPVILKAFDPEDPRIDAHIELFKECGGLQGIPTFVDHFTTLGSEFIAHSHTGIRLQGILNDRLFHISKENTIRIGYRLFRIIQSTHLKGFLHRDIRPLTIMFDVAQNGELCVNLSYFGHATRIYAPSLNNPVFLQPFHSLNVTRGEIYTRIDDYLSIVFVMLTCQTVNPFHFNTNRHLTALEKKENFHANPYAALTPETMWLGDLYLQLEEMRADRISHLQAMTAVRRAIPGFDPQSAITYHYDAENGHLLID